MAAARIFPRRIRTGCPIRSSGLKRLGPTIGQAFTGCTGGGRTDGRLDLGCVARYGMFVCDVVGSVRRLHAPVFYPCSRRSSRPPTAPRKQFLFYASSSAFNLTDRTDSFHCAPTSTFCCSPALNGGNLAESLESVGISIAARNRRAESNWRSSAQS
jgi:hypothetical protein